jgi:hypothetical protein
MTTGNILKSADVKLEGQVRLDAQYNNSTAKKSPAAKTSQTITAQANIVETNPNFVVIQLTCSCGAKTLIKCRHTDGSPTNQMPKQK